MPALDKTEATNLMRQAVGEPEVDAAEVAAQTQPEVKSAVRALDRETRKVQLRGWSFNREQNVTLPIDGSGNIILDADVIHVDPRGQTGRYTIRKVSGVSQLYDRYEQTFVFTSDMKAEVHRLLDFDDLPFVAQEYIASRAARVFAEAYLGEQQGALRADEAKAEAMFFDVEAEMGDYNLSQSYDVWRTTGRRTPLDTYGGSFDG